MGFSAITGVNVGPRGVAHDPTGEAYHIRGHEEPLGRPCQTISRFAGVMPSNARICDVLSTMHAIDDDTLSFLACLRFRSGGMCLPKLRVCRSPAWYATCYARAKPLAPRPPAENPRVTVVGDHAQTIEGLRRYLRAAGVEAHATRSLTEGTVNPPTSDALVIFPDEFSTEEVLESIEALQKGHPKLKLLLITSSPQHYHSSRLMDAAQPPILLPKPAFGWSILDAIRASSSTEEQSP